MRLESLAPTSLGAEVFQPVFIARRGDADEAIWLAVVDGRFTPTPMNMSTFMAGANGMLSLRHPTLVRVVVVDREAEFSVVGYEALPGAESMVDVITGGSSRTLLGRTALEVARGLAFLHRRELLHGTLTPSTVVLWEGTPVLWEHGIAALCSPSVFGPRARSLGGDVVAPEVPSGAQLTPAADVYAWGAVLASVATGMLGAEAVTAVADGDADQARLSGLFDLIREALSPEANARPRDGTHLLERLLALDLDGPPVLSSRRPGRETGAPPTAPDLSDLARRYLDEMSAVESRGVTPPVGIPLRVEDSESSGALGRLALRKAKVATDSQKILGFLDEIEQATESTPAAVSSATTTPKPRAAPAAAPSNVGSPAEPTPEDSAAAGIPLWRAASSARPKAEDAADESLVAGPAAGDLGPSAIELGSIEVAGIDEDAEAELRDAFRDLTAAADARTQVQRPVAAREPLAGVPDDPTATLRDELDFGDLSGAQDTPVPTRLPDPDAPPKTGGWLRRAERTEDPTAAVGTKLPPVQSYGDGVHKRTFEPAAPQGDLEDQTPRDPVVVAGPTTETSGLAKLRRLWPRKAPEPDSVVPPPAAEAGLSLRKATAVPAVGGPGKGQAEPPATPPVAAPPAATKAKKPKKSPARAGAQPPLAAAPAPPEPVPPLVPPPVSRPEVLPPAPPPVVARAQPVAPFIPPRTPGPHGPRASIAASVLATIVGGAALLATVCAVQHQGGLDKLVFGARDEPDGSPMDGPVPVAAMGPQCPAGAVPLPQADPIDPAAAIVCIDIAEFPGLGEIPLTGIDFAEAERRCEGRGRRLCATEEWRLACAGVAGRKLPYGDEPEPERCPMSPKGDLVPGGTYGGCVSPEGVVDLVGNAAEWVAEGVALGGSAATRTATCQTQLRPGKRARRASIGARCCVDVVP